MCDLRRRFEEQLADFAGRTYNGDTGAFYFENIADEGDKLSLLKQTYKSFLFLSESFHSLFFSFLSETGYFLSGWQCPASPAVNPSG